MNRPLEGDCKLELLDFSNPEGKMVKLLVFFKSNKRLFGIPLHIYQAKPWKLNMGAIFALGHLWKMDSIMILTLEIIRFILIAN